jgi:DNA mismatch endonuclease, patch repair protein
MKTYKRDYRSPNPTFKHTSRVMSSIKGKDTKPEILLRKALFNRGLKGYRLHVKHLPGKPDIVFTKSKLAIFVHGCFWHRCPKCQMHTPKHNTVYWQTKFDKNVQRDIKHVQQLSDMDWKVLTIWECELKTILRDILSSIKESLTPFKPAV